jgi:hypothetical protein
LPELRRGGASSSRDEITQRDPAAADQRLAVREQETVEIEVPR